MSTLEMHERDMVRAQAMKYMQRLQRRPFGTDVDPPATAAQVRELFDDDLDLAVPGFPTPSLRSLERDRDEEGWRFRIEGFESRGVWEVEVSRDIDGNGTFRGVRGTETPTTGGAPEAGDGVTVTDLRSENTDDLLRIEIFWNGQSVLRTVRAAPVEGA